MQRPAGCSDEGIECQTDEAANEAEAGAADRAAWRDKLSLADAGSVSFRTYSYSAQQSSGSRSGPAIAILGGMSHTKPTERDSFLYLLAEMERCLDRIDPAIWTPEQRGNVEARLFHLATRIAWKAQR